MSNYKILIVEDFEPSRNIISDILDALGYDFETASDGVEAIFAIKDKDFDLILMDIQLPILNGFETTEHIRRNLSYPKNTVPIIAMTGWDHVHDLSKTYKDEGFDGLIEKPFSLDKLDEILKKIFDKNVTTSIY